MNYIQLMNRFWRLNRIYEFNAFETQLYFKLLDICNSTGWKNGFFKSNRFLCGEISMDERRLIKSRDKLIDVRLINYISGSEKKEQSVYFIIDAGDPDDEPFRQPQADKSNDSITLSKLGMLHGAGNAVYQTEGIADDNHKTTLPEICSDPAFKMSAKMPPDCSTAVAGMSDNNKYNTETKKEIETEIKKNNNSSDQQNRNNVCVENSENLFGELDKSTSPTHTTDENILNRIFHDFNKVCNRLAPVRSFSNKRKKMVAGCIKELGVENVEKMMQKAGESDYLAGNRFGWKADFNWIFTIENCERILEGTFDNHRPVRDKTDHDPYSRPSPFAFLRDIYTGMESTGTEPANNDNDF